MCFDHCNNTPTPTKSRGVKRTTKFKPNLATARPLPAHFVAALTIAAKPISTHLKGLNADQCIKVA